MRRFLLPALVAIVSAVPAAAQQDTVPEAPRGGGVEMIGGLRLGWPQKLSAYVGVGIPEKRFQGGYTGWSVTVEPGLGGGLIGIGRTSSGALATTSRVQLAVLRTWGDPWLVGPDQTYVGVDSRFSIVFAGLALGGYVRIPDVDTDPGVLFTASFVVGN